MIERNETIFVNIKEIYKQINKLNYIDFWIHECDLCGDIIYSQNLKCNECNKNQKIQNFHAAGVLIYTIIKNEPYILLGRASINKGLTRRFHNEFFGGVRENDENAAETAVRETKEETGELINIDKNKLKFLCRYKSLNFKTNISKDYILFLSQVNNEYINNAISKFKPGYEVDKLLLVPLKKIFNANLSKFSFNLISKCYNEINNISYILN